MIGKEVIARVMGWIPRSTPQSPVKTESEPEFKKNQGVLITGPVQVSFLDFLNPTLYTIAKGTVVSYQGGKYKVRINQGSIDGTYREDTIVTLPASYLSH